MIGFSQSKEEKSDIDFTIIVPHYNSYDSLRILLDSIGIHDNIQIIVVDDHSDNIKEELIKLEKKYSYVEFFQNEAVNKSAGTCRNIGLQHAKGKWVLFADADDYFEKNYYEIIERYIDVEEDMVIFTPTSKDKVTGEISDRHLGYRKYIYDYLKNSSIETELALRYKFEPPWSKMIKREVIQQNSISFDNVMVANDTMFSAKCGYYCKKIYPVKDIIYCVTKGENTLTSFFTRERQDVRVSVFCSVYRYLKVRLTKDEFEKLNLRGAPMIYNLVRNMREVGVIYILKVIMKFKRNHISIITRMDCRRLLNGFYIKKLLRKY